MNSTNKERHRKIKPGTSSWSSNRWRMNLEIEQSKKEIQDCLQLQTRTHIVRQIKLQRILHHSGKKATARRVQKEDDEFVQKATGDALEYHNVRDSERKNFVNLQYFNT